MAATFRIITHRVGEKGQTTGIEVLRIQQLLKLNKYNVRCTGVWDTASRDALQAFQEKLRREQGLVALEYGQLSPIRPYIMPDDSMLFELAYRAGVVIRLAPGRRGDLGFQDVHDWCVEHKVGFDWFHAVWGLHGYLPWAVVTRFDPDTHVHSFDLVDPLALNCTLYANLMMSVWFSGTAHGPPFSANVANTGGANHLAVQRYQYPRLVKCESIAAIRAAARQPGRLYCLEAGDWVGHIALLLGDTVYECNVSTHAGSNVVSMSLARWWNSHAYTTWVSGPSPT